jgi:transcriptional regulator with XRE-family HTH domain
MPSQQDFGTRLYNLRVAQSLTQKEFSEIAGVSQALISQIESGKKSLPTEAFWRLIRRFGREAESLVTTGTETEVAKSLVESWRTYDTIQKAHSELLQNLQTLAESLRPYQGSLATMLPNATLRSQLDSLIGGARIERYRDGHFPPKEHIPEFRNMPMGTNVNEHAIEVWKTLLDLCNGLSKSDLQLVVRIIERLRMKSNGE